MASAFYKNHLLVSRPSYAGTGTEWLVHVSISWRQGAGNFHFQKLSPPGSLATEAAAIEEGFRIGRLWVDTKILE
jgi:hypothetical protein